MRDHPREEKPMDGTTTFRILLLAIPAALLATLGDGIHVLTGTLAYPDPFLFGQAWWVFPGFFLVFMFMGHAYALVAERLPAAVPADLSRSGGTIRELVEAASAFIFVYMMSGFGNARPDLLSVIFYGAFAVRWLFTYDRAWLLLLAIVMAIGGMAAEGALSALGLVAYRHANIFHVPLWLGGLYVHGAFALREGMRCFVYASNK